MYEGALAWGTSVVTSCTTVPCILVFSTAFWVSVSQTLFMWIQLLFAWTQWNWYIQKPGGPTKKCCAQQNPVYSFPCNSHHHLLLCLQRVQGWSHFLVRWVDLPSLFTYPQQQPEQNWRICWFDKLATYRIKSIALEQCEEWIVHATHRFPGYRYPASQRIKNNVKFSRVQYLYFKCYGIKSNFYIWADILMRKTPDCRRLKVIKKWNFGGQMN